MSTYLYCMEAQLSRCVYISIIHIQPKPAAEGEDKPATAEGEDKPKTEEKPEGESPKEGEEPPKKEGVGCIVQSVGWGWGEELLALYFIREVQVPAVSVHVWSSHNCVD